MTPDTNIEIDIIVNPLSAQFEAVRHGAVVGLLDYDQTGNHFDLRHTFVPVELRGQHIANILVTAVLDRIQGIGGTISATCTYVEAFVDQHPRYGDLVGPVPSSSASAMAAAAARDREPNVLASRPDTLNVFPDTIRTERLTMRPWSLDDTDDAYGIYADPRVTQWIRPFIRPVATRELMRRQLVSWIRQSDHLRPPQGRWAIELDDTATVIGGAHLLEMPTRSGSCLVVSLELAASATGQGLAAEAGHGLIHSAFSIDPSLETLHALTHPSNLAAVGTLTRIGLRAIPGVERRHGADLVLFVISRTEFDAVERADRAPGDGRKDGSTSP